MNVQATLANKLPWAAANRFGPGYWNGWAAGFDIVVHNECFAHVTDKEFVDRILKPHREGLPAILYARHGEAAVDPQRAAALGTEKHRVSVRA